MEVYGIYLMNGGDPETFQKFTQYDVQTLYTVYESLERRRMKHLTENMAKLLGLEVKK